MLKLALPNSSDCSNGQALLMENMKITDLLLYVSNQSALKKKKKKVFFSSDIQLLLSLHSNACIAIPHYVHFKNTY